MRDENDLLAAIGRGDESALEELYDGYARRLYGFGIRLLGDEGLAEELVQETFVRLWRQSKKFNAGKASGRTFIFTVARRIAIDLYRRPSSRPIELSAEEHTADRSDDVVTSVVVRQAMASITDTQREVLELLHFQGLTQTEAAAALGVPHGTIKSRAYEATRALRTAFQERGIHA